MLKIPMVLTFSKPTIQIFLGGIFVGFFIALLLLLKTNSYSNNRISFYDNKQFQDYAINFKFDRAENVTISDQLLEKVRILCFIITSPINHLKRAVHVRNTWGKRCSKLVFMSSQKDSILPSVALPVKEGRANLWRKTKEALKYVYKHYYGDYDWFFKADDDTYVIMENLRYFLHPINSSQPVYFGCQMKLPGSNLNYMSGGAGYVLSKEALNRYINNVSTWCQPQDTGSEDVELGKCLQLAGVHLGNSLDEKKRHRFTPVFINEMLIPGVLNQVSWFMSMMHHPVELNMECCSDRLISTHYVKPNEMYLIEYLIYHVIPFGRGCNSTAL